MTEQEKSLDSQGFQQVIKHTQPIFNRPPRIRPELPDQPIKLPTPPQTKGGGRGWSIVTSLLTSGALIGGAYFVSQSTGRSPIYMVTMVVGAAAFLLVSILQIVVDYWQRWKQRRRYRQELRTTLVKLLDGYIEQQQIHYSLYPELTQAQMAQQIAQLETQHQALAKTILPRSWWQRILRKPVQLPVAPFHLRWMQKEEPFSSLIDIAGAEQPAIPKPNLWERRPDDPDFLELRIATGPQPSSYKITKGSSAEPSMEEQDLIDMFSTIQQVPVTLSLREVGSLGIAGERSLIIPFIHALLWQTAVFHAPSEVYLITLYGHGKRNDWSWMAWLQHTFYLNGDKRRRMLATHAQDIDQLQVLLIDELSRRSEQSSSDESTHHPHLIILIDDEQTLRHSTVVKELFLRGKEHGMYVISLAERWQQVASLCGATLHLNQDHGMRYALAGKDWSDWFPQIQAPTQLSESLSRSLRSLLLAETGGDREIPRSVRLYSLLQELAPDSSDILHLWNQPIKGAWHATVPIGSMEGSKHVYLDLREHHDGPHGIIAGKTGAGKSELLQTVITAIAATHAPDRAQFLLIDYKGGASLRVFADLPHSVGLVTDLQDSRLADRAVTAMKSEIRRRKDFLKQAEVKDITDYRELNKPEPLPNLLIIIDEFDTMVKERPTFVDELITVVKQGRSLGVHLLVATQQPSTAVKEDIKTQLQYWIALRLGSAADSREMLQRPDGFFLPSDVPGRAYMRVGTKLVLLQVARVSAPFQEDEDNDQIAERRGGSIVQLGTSHTAYKLDKKGRTIRDIDIIVDKIKQAGRDYQRTEIWCPPLPQRMTLEACLSQSVQPDQWWEHSDYPQLVAAFGIRDLPQESLQEPALLNLRSGNILLFGSPGSGKTTFLRTLILSLGINYHPKHVWIYAIDAGGRGLNNLKSLPHMGGIVQVRKIDEVRRVLWIIQQLLEEREHQGSQEHHFQLEDVPAVILMIDKFALFKGEYEQLGLVDDLIALAAQGRQYGIYLVLTADRPNDVPHRLQGLFDTRLVLRLTDDNDSLALMGRRDAGAIPIDNPGRGYQLLNEQGWLEFQTALPFFSLTQQALAAEEVHNLMDKEIYEHSQLTAESMRSFFDKQALTTQQPPQVRLLPALVEFETVWQQFYTQATQRDQQAIELVAGLEAQSLGPATFRLSEATPALMVIGGSQAGKTTTLRAMLRSIALQYTTDELQFVLVDPRRNSFQNVALAPHEPIYLTTEQQLEQLAKQLEQLIEEPSDKKWVICIDDFDIAMLQYQTQFSKPFSGQKTFLVALEKVVNLGRDRGFSLIIGVDTSNPISFLGQINSYRYGIILQPHTFPPATNLLGVKLPIPLTGNQGLPGRGLMVAGNRSQWIQVASA